MKKVISLILALLMCLTLCACGEKTPDIPEEDKTVLHFYSRDYTLEDLEKEWNREDDPSTLLDNNGHVILSATYGTVYMTVEKIENGWIYSVDGVAVSYRYGGFQWSPISESTWREKVARYVEEKVKPGDRVAIVCKASRDDTYTSFHYISEIEIVRKGAG